MERHSFGRHDFVTAVAGVVVDVSGSNAGQQSPSMGHPICCGAALAKVAVIATTKLRMLKCFSMLRRWL
jgi:hypothetical protein